MFCQILFGLFIHKSIVNLFFWEVFHNFFKGVRPRLFKIVKFLCQTRSFLNFLFNITFPESLSRNLWRHSVRLGFDGLIWATKP